MKKTFVISSLLMLSGMLHPVFSQNSGIYMNSEDFTNGILNHGIDCATEKHKIFTPEKKNVIKVVHKGQKYQYKKSDIFGYRDCEGKDYRFFNKQIYQVNRVVPK